MALSFLYRALVRVLQLVRLSCSKDSSVAVEIVILRHQVAVLRLPGPPSGASAGRPGPAGRLVAIAPSPSRGTVLRPAGHAAAPAL